MKSSWALISPLKRSVGPSTAMLRSAAAGASPLSDSGTKAAGKGGRRAVSSLVSYRSSATRLRNAWAPSVVLEKWGRPQGRLRRQSLQRSLSSLAHFAAHAQSVAQSPLHGVSLQIAPPCRIPLLIFDN